MGIHVNFDSNNSDWQRRRLTKALDGEAVSIVVLDGETFSGIFSLNGNTVSLWDGKEDKDIPLGDIQQINVI